MTELKKQIEEAIQNFSVDNTKTAAQKLLNTLGYLSNKKANINLAALNKRAADRNINVDWKEFKTAELIFQLTDDEVKQQNSMFTVIDEHLIQSYLFFAVELNSNQYSRTQLSNFTRSINRLYNMPVMIFFRYDELVTIAVVNRRLHKRDATKDVLEKVTLIKDINIQHVHRAHIEILFELCIGNLVNEKKESIKNFEELHNAWQKIFDLKELNNNFYKDLFDWYLWAVKHVRFPQIRAAKEDMLDDHTHQSESVIRLLTRLLFCWFLKEKNELIKNDLFDKEKLHSILKNFKGEKSDSSIYYHAIIQNLFFATLSVPISERKYIKENKGFPNADYGNQYVFRFQEAFINPNENLKLFKDIPFLNGGLFECLDVVPKPGEDDRHEIRLDGFSTKANKQAQVPDFLFWGKHEHVNLSKELDNPRKSDVTVHGIIDILNKYKFTIEENTPVEEEIALDPELLGKVFENLLAFYNPETKVTARKQTGSFYTPREIVNYMVDESLIAYLKTKMLEETAGFVEVGKTQSDIFGNAARKQLKIETPLHTNRWKQKEGLLETELRNLLSYAEKEIVFNDDEKKLLIDAIDVVKILDPACGSGAFPMGMLHKLVHVLHKLDPKNALWEQRQIKKAEQIEDLKIRNEAIQHIETAFANNELDYGRKLYLIQNCIYGIDIQPVAIQISKLRFFISLIVDQKIKTDADNFGLLPLPNLDFKMVAANTLIAAPEDGSAAIGSLGLTLEDTFEKKFREHAEKYFSIAKPKDKEKLRQKIERLIEQKVAEKIEQVQKLSTHTDERYSRHIAEKYKTQIAEKENAIKLWKSYCNLFKYEAVGFFETKYFFPEVKNGFDVVIGNPPYIQIQKINKEKKQELENQKFSVYEKVSDIYCLFFEKGIQLLTKKGTLTFITSNKWMRADYGESLRKFFVTKCTPILLYDFGSNPVFEATVDTNILILTKDILAEKSFFACRIAYGFKEDSKLEEYFRESKVLLQKQNENPWIIGDKKENALKFKIESIGDKLINWGIKINYGIKTGLNTAFIVDEKTKKEIVSQDKKSIEILKPILLGKDIKRYSYSWQSLWLINSHNGLKSKNLPRVDLRRNYPAVFNYLKKFHKDLEERSDKGDDWTNLRNCAYLEDFAKPKIAWGNLALQSQFSFINEEIFINAPSPFFVSDNLYLLAVLNSKLGSYYIKSLGVSRSGGYVEFKPMFVEQIPIPKSSTEIQNRFITLVAFVLHLKQINKDSSSFENLIDAMVYELYFPEAVQAANAEVLKHLNNLPELKEEWSTDKKLSVIEKVQKELSNPAHPVSIAMQKIQEIEEVKVIEGKK